ncbi:acetyl-CoA carboxylase biotin carboxylase subunit [Xanthobacter sp. V3C-4]|uniref:acetyl-CoA carboxylase biotin carboxylase subunit n=1 Tax=Xanthobacter autotrophicus (strain ATCC BAA-1158 / Py2) TaxID=78245 RepID=UPI0037274590
MFDTVLIANRGEIALRIQRGCRRLGLACVQAHSEADRDAAYVRLADAAVCVGPAPAADSYLNKEALLLAARASGAGAIHPGYGFLSENGDFARLVEEEGLVFIGPPADAIALMGDKISAKRAMIEAGVPCVPGYEGDLPPGAHALEIARSIGFPVIVKAAGGGGGRGMRVVRAEAELLSAVATTREEAARAFGNSTVYLERFLERPRHVEIQVVADGQGNAAWIGARDCSVQRRHQKIIEEAPAPDVPTQLLEEVGARCVAACRAMGYRGAGTFEFLYDEGALFFIEMNTRLQVEHTVTEMVSGLDIVELQLRIARGERLPFAQDDVRLSGHAIECRINAEDPRTFLPSAGRIGLWHAPGGPGVRVDTHVVSGYTVPQHYDSMIAKIITHGATRAEAIARMQAALAECVVEGIRTNIPLHRELLADPDFAAGGVSIHFLERRGTALPA